MALENIAIVVLGFVGSRFVVLGSEGLICLTNGSHPHQFHRNDKKEVTRVQIYASGAAGSDSRAMAMTSTQYRCGSPSVLIPGRPSIWKVLRANFERAMFFSPDSKLDFRHKSLLFHNS